MNRLTFGWKNSGAIFQREMSEAMGELNTNKKVIWYLDDLIIGGVTRDEGATLTGEVMYSILYK